MSAAQLEQGTTRTCFNHKEFKIKNATPEYFGVHYPKESKRTIEAINLMAINVKSPNAVRAGMSKRGGGNVAIG